MSTTKYLKVEFGTGNFFERSKEPKEGFKEHLSTKGNISYRKMYDRGVGGEVKGLALKDTPIGKEMEFKLYSSEEDVWYVICFPLYSVNGDISEFSQSLLNKCPGINLGDKIAISGYNFTPEGGSRNYVGFSIKLDGEKLNDTYSRSFYQKDDNVLVEGDIPPLVWKEQLGKRRPTASSKEAITDFFINVLEKQIDRLKQVTASDGNGSDKQQQPVTVDDYQEDDLPF